MKKLCILGLLLSSQVFADTFFLFLSKNDQDECVETVEGKLDHDTVFVSEADSLRLETEYSEILFFYAAESLMGTRYIVSSSMERTQSPVSTCSSVESVPPDSPQSSLEGLLSDTSYVRLWTDLESSSDEYEDEDEGDPRISAASSDEQSDSESDSGYQSGSERSSNMNSSIFGRLDVDGRVVVPSLFGDQPVSPALAETGARVLRANLVITSGNLL